MARLLFVSLMPSEYSGASEWIFIATAKLALNRGHNVLYSVPFNGVSHPYLMELKNAGVNLHFRPINFNPNLVVRIKNKMLRILTDFRNRNVFHGWWQILKDFSRFSPDLIYINEGISYQTLLHKDLLFVLKNISCPAFVFNHGHDEDRVYNEVEADLLFHNYFSRFSKIYFLSRNQLKIAERQLLRPLKNAQYVKNMNRIFHLKPLPFPNFPLKMATVSRLDVRVKGHHLLLEALAEIKKKFYNDWCLDIYGYGPDESLLQKLIAYFDLSKEVKVCGKVENLIDLWADHHIILQPSIIESHGQSIVEAALLGRPALVTPRGDMPLIVVNDKTGFVTYGIGVNAIVEALERVFSSTQEKLHLMGLAASEHVKNFIDPAPWETMLNDILTTVGLPLEGNN